MAETLILCCFLERRRLNSTTHSQQARDSPRAAVHDAIPTGGDNTGEANGQVGPASVTVSLYCANGIPSHVAAGVSSLDVEPASRPTSPEPSIIGRAKCVRKPGRVLAAATRFPVDVLYVVYLKVLDQRR